MDGRDGAPRVEVHSKAGCPHCDEVKRWLDAEGVPYADHPHDDDAERQRFYDGLGLVGEARAVPQVIVVDGADRYRVGGCQATKVSGLRSLFRPEATGPGLGA